MNPDLRITGVRLLPGSWHDAANGLLGWVQFTLNGALRLDGVALRRTLGGHLALSYPSKPGPGGHSYHYVHPLDDATRLEIERQVLEALELQGAVG